MRHWWQHTSSEDPSHEEAKRAFAKSIEDRQRAERTAEEEVEPLMEQLKERRRVNHYTELFEQVLRGRK